MVRACTPWHEAGHALVAEYAGIEVLSVTIGGAGGHVDRGFIPASAPADAYQVMMMAGAAAEELYWQDPDAGWEHSRDDRWALRRFGHSDGEMLAWAREARSVIASQQTAWKALAHILAAGGVFPGAMVRSVLAGNPVNGRMALAALEERRVS